MIADINGGLFTLFILIGLVFLAVPIWGIVDAAQRPDSQWQAAGQNKTTWIVLMAAGALFCGIVGFVLALVYLLSIRPKLQAEGGYA